MVRHARLMIFGAVVFLATAPFVLLSSPVAAQTGPNLYIDVAGQPSCSTNTAPPPTAGDAVCAIQQGGTFTVRGFIGSLGGLPDLNQNTISGYAGMQFRMFYSAGLTAADRPDEGELGPGGSPYWPDCSVRAEFRQAGVALPSCLVAGEDESTYTGEAVELDFVCSQLGRQTVTLDEAFSYLHNEFHGTAPEGDGDEVLTIDCVSGAPGATPGVNPAANAQLTAQPGSTSQPAADGQLPTAGGGSEGDVGSSNLQVAVVAGVVAFALIAIASAAFIARRWQVK